jgi:hypothetical protein
VDLFEDLTIGYLLSSSVFEKDIGLRNPNRLTDCTFFHHVHKKKIYVIMTWNFLLHGAVTLNNLIHFLLHCSGEYGTTTKTIFTSTTGDSQVYIIACFVVMGGSDN